MRELVRGADLLTGLARRRAGGRTAPFPDLPGAPVAGPSAYVLARLAAWRLLHDVPFAYLVPDAAMLPPESIRFFHLDDGWLDALCDAALGLGADPAAWDERAPRLLPQVRTPMLASMPFVRELRRGRLVIGPPDRAWPPPSPQPPAEPKVTGFLLRSALVSGWPGLQVRAWTTTAVPDGADPTEHAGAHPEQVVRLLRIERLSPAVLLVLFAGVPAMVWLEEPHQGIQLGVDVTGIDPDLDDPIGPPAPHARTAARRYTVPVRDESGVPTGETVAVPMRSGGAPGVIDVARLADALDDARPLPADRGSAALGLALLQPPARQRFAGDPERAR